jgi:hypothetical protein
VINYNKINIFKGVVDLRVDILNINEKSIIYFVDFTPICQFDQHSRARIGVKFFEYEVSKKPEYIFYSNVYNMLLHDEQFFKETFKILTKLEKIRNTEQKKETFNLMSRRCSYKVEQTFESLRGQMNRRLKFCEEEFIVGLHWLLRMKLIENGYKKAELFLPDCDLSEECNYSKADYLSNLFGCLFAGCGRWKDKSNYSTFNESCTNITELQNQLRIIIPPNKFGDK